EDNMRAIAKTIDALRGIARWGTGDMLEAAFTGFTALPAPSETKEWWEVLGVPRHASQDEIKAAYRRLASENHPDRGGNAARMAQINDAYRQAGSAS
ncbi:J domain-containing protein, partial [Methylibium sp.]